MFRAENGGGGGGDDFYSNTKYTPHGETQFISKATVHNSFNMADIFEPRDGIMWPTSRNSEVVSLEAQMQRLAVTDKPPCQPSKLEAVKEPPIWAGTGEAGRIRSYTL